MTDFIQFGWYAWGFIMASSITILIVMHVGKFLFGAIQTVADWCDRNGWNG